MADEGGKPVITIDVDSSQFDGFMAKYNSYRDGLKDMPEAWKSTNTAVKDLAGGFSEAASEFLKLDAAAISPRFGRVFSEFQRISVTSSKAWHSINKDIETAGKGMSLLGRLALNFGSGLGIAGLAGVAGIGAAIAAVSSTASDVAARNKTARSLGLQVGQEDAFDTDYKKFGLDSGDLQHTADAQSDQRQWSPWLSAGLSVKQIQNEPADELTYDAARAMSQKYREWQSQGLPAAQLAQSYGFTDMFSLSQLRTGASYNDTDWAKAHQDYLSDVPKFAIDRKTADSATDFMQHQQENLKTIGASFDRAELILAPALNKWSDSATNLVTNFLNVGAPQAKDVIDAVDGPPVPRAEDDQYPNTVLGGLTKFGYGLRDAWSNLSTVGTINKDTPAPAFHWDWKHPFGTFNDTEQKEEAPKPMGYGDFSDEEKKWVLPSRTLGVVASIESHGDSTLTNPVTGAQGMFQLMPGTSKQFGVDPFNVEQSADAAGHLIRDNLNQWHGSMAKALAQYDGDTHIGADEQKFNGAWLHGAKQETIDYLYKAEKGGLDLNLNQEDMAYIASHLSKEAQHSKDTVAANIPRIKSDTVDSSGDGGSGGPGGYPFRLPSPSVNMAPIKIGVNVSAPAGSNVGVALGGMPR